MNYIYRFIFLIALFGTTSSAFGQFTVSPNPASNNDFAFSEPDVVANSTIFNESDDTLSVTWFRTVHLLPQGWETAVCDIVQCYFTFVDSQTFELGPGAEGNMDVHVYPDGSEGSAMIEVKMIDNANPTDTLDVFYLFNTALSAGVESFRQTIKVFPNPTVDRITIEAGHDVHTAEVFGVDGRLLRNVALNGSSTFDVSELPSGPYVLRLRDREGAILSSSIVVRE